MRKLKKNFPRNPYKDLIDLRIEKCRNTIADYEFLVGEFYLKRDQYKAAISRFETLLSKYPDYKKEENLLLDLGITYKKSGDPEKAGLYLNRLIEKYPNSRLKAAAQKELSSLKKEGRKKIDCFFLLRLMNYYPAFLNLQGKKAVVVGGGKVAERKVLTLIRAGALVTVISPLLTEEAPEGK